MLANMMTSHRRQWALLTLLIWMLILPWFVAGQYSDMRRELDAQLINFAQNFAESKLLADWPEASPFCDGIESSLNDQVTIYKGEIYILIRDLRCNPEVIYNSFPADFSALPTSSGYSDLSYQGQTFRILVYQAGALHIEQAAGSQLLPFVWSMLKTALLSFVLIGLLMAAIVWLVRKIIQPVKKSAVPMPLSPESGSSLDQDVALLSELTGEFSFAGEPMQSVRQLNTQLQTALKAEHITLEINDLSEALAQQTIAVPERVMLRSLLACARLLHAQQSLQLELFTTKRGIGWRMRCDDSIPSANSSALVMDLAILEAATQRFVGSYHVHNQTSGTLQAELIFPLVSDAMLSAVTDNRPTGPVDLD